MTGTKYIGMDVHKESVSIAVMNGFGKIVMECVIETKASMVLQCIHGLRRRRPRPRTSSGRKGRACIRISGLTAF